MIINFKQKQQEYEINKFYKNGTIPSAIYNKVISSAAIQVYGPWAIKAYKDEQLVDLTNLELLLNELTAKYKYLYTSQKYRQSANPLDTLWQEFQLALFTPETHRDKFNTWFIDIVSSQLDTIKIDIELSINLIEQFFTKHTTVIHSVQHIVDIKSRRALMLQSVISYINN